MRILPRLHTCLLVAWGAASLWLTLPLVKLRAIEPPAATAASEHHRVVLLKNDHCLTGIVRQLGDHVVVEFADNARVSKPVGDIQCIADDLEGIYQHKLTHYSHLGSGENIRLARWCLAVGLDEHAVQHFLAVNKEASNNALVKQLGVELREQLLRDEAFRTYLGLPPLASPSEQPQVQNVASSTGANLTPIVPAVVAAFTEHVQPIVLNRCSQSGCHGFSATNRLKIIEPIGNARARISEQNCRSALQFVAVDDSNMSVLLRYALTAHGLQKSPSITSLEPQHSEALQSWTTFARNPVMAAVESQSGPTTGQTAPAVYTDRSQQPAMPGALRPVAPGAAQLRTVPLQPKFGVQGGAAQPSISELDELDDQVRRALGEPPRPGSTTPAQAPQPGLSPTNRPAQAFAPGTSAASMPGAASSSVAPSPNLGAGGSSTALTSSHSVGSTPVDPFDPAEFNRAAAAKVQR